MKRKFINITAQYYFSGRYTSLSECEILLNIDQCKEIRMTQGYVKDKTVYLILFDKCKPETHIPCVVFATKEEMQTKYEELKKQLL